MFTLRCFMLFLLLCVIACQLPDDFATLPWIIQDDLLDIQMKKSKLKAGLFLKKIEWDRAAPINYIFTIQLHQEPAPPVEPATILVCNKISNYTGLYDIVETIPTVFKDARAQVDKMGPLGSDVKIEYDSTYKFPSSYIYSFTRINYEVNDQNEVIAMSAVGPLEQGHKILEFIPLKDNAEECMQVL